MKRKLNSEKAHCCIGNIDIIGITRGKGFSIVHRKGREKNGFIFVQSGAMRFLFFKEKESFEVTAGGLLFIPAATVYTSEYLEERTHVILAQFDLLQGKLPAVLATPQRIEMFDAERRMNELSAPSGKVQTEESLSLYHTFRVHELLWRAVDRLQQIPTKFLKLTPALSDLQRHFAHNKKVEYYAELCGMSESGFRRLFHEYTGQSPVDYRNALRLEEADKLIATGEYAVEEAALAVGFHNVSFFCRSYKKHFGCTPLGLKPPEV